jgi:hypothetical protein
VNRFIIVIAERKELERLALSESCSAALSSISPNILVIHPNIFLFQSEKGFQEVYDSLPTSLRQGDQVLLFEIGDQFRGCARARLFSELEKFFPQ